MRTNYVFLIAVAMCIAATLCGCSKSNINDAGGYGTLKLNLNSDQTVTSVTGITKAAVQPTDLTVSILKGGQLKNRYSPIGVAAKEIALAPGNDYLITAYSEELSSPAFDNPVYGDSLQFTITAEQSLPLSLVCTQINAGVKIVYGNTFKGLYSTYTTSISDAYGFLTYGGATTASTGYFAPGTVQIMIIADGKVFNQSFTLKAKHLYTLTIDQEDPGTKGDLSLSLSVSTDVTEENITIQLPAEGTQGTQSVIFREGFGSSAVSGTVYLNNFNGWDNTSSTYSGDDISIRSDIESDYPGASGGNHLRFYADGYFTIEGINTSGYTSLNIILGLMTGGNDFWSEQFIAEVYVPGTDSWIRLTCIRNLTPIWEELIIASGIPSTSSLKLRFSGAPGYKIDDIRVMGISLP